MFSSGTRVVVLASSVSKGLCPKKNSIGYVISASEAYLIDFGKGSKARQFLINIINVMFSRYGNEQKRRSEHRAIVNILPIPIHLSDTPDTGKILNNFINGELRSNSYWNDEVRNMMTEDYNVPVGVVAPAGEFRMNRLSPGTTEETSAWMQSLLMDPGFLHSAYERLKFLKCSGDKTHEIDLLRWICESKNDRMERLRLITWTIDRNENIIKMVNIMRTVQAVNQRRCNMNDLSFFEKQVRAGIFKTTGAPPSQNFSKLRAFVGKYAARYYEPGSSETKEVIVKKTSHSDTLKDLSARINLAKKFILSLVPQQD